LETETPSEAALSVVLIVRHPDDTPDAVLAALARQDEIEHTAVILVDGRDPAPSANIDAARSWLTVIKAPGLSMPHLKALGAKTAKGRAIAFLEPKATPGADWLMRVHTALVAHPGAALGGGVKFAGTPNPANQAAFAFEYGQFTVENIGAGTVSDLSANNMILPREPFLALCSDILATEGLNKPFCQKRLSEAEIPIILVPDMAVELRSQHRLWQLLKSRFKYARCFGGTRIKLSTPARRWLLRIASPAVPFLLFRRHSRTMRRMNVQRQSALGYLALAALCLAWAAGEAAGSWWGTGNSCEALY